MESIHLVDLTGDASTEAVAAFVCTQCGIWRHAYSPTETQLRALVESNMSAFIAAMWESTR